MSFTAKLKHTDSFRKKKKRHRVLPFKINSFTDPENIHPNNNMKFCPLGKQIHIWIICALDLKNIQSLYVVKYGDVRFSDR